MISKVVTRKSAIAVAASFLSLFSTQTIFAADAIVHGLVKRVVDGDTIHVESDDGASEQDVLKIRMVGIDAPEAHFPAPGGGMVGQGQWGAAATNYLKGMIDRGYAVTLRTKGLDRYQRTLGVVFYQEHDVNLAMVQAGWAIPYVICEGEACDEGFTEREGVFRLSDSCRNARANGAGIFNPRRPLREMPFEFRMRIGNRSPERWVGNIRTKQLYDPEDYAEVDVCDRLFFQRKGDAVRLGYRPADAS